MENTLKKIRFWGLEKNIEICKKKCKKWVDIVRKSIRFGGLPKAFL
ncbi:MAG: hypothetical protein JSV84_02890 [Gemmatimonadota bacterium]|nr:MAG: hypothetical protein JSV84_02890 [Gemmatimonadota bacterium]